jgi:hypothetical protein
MLSVVMRRPQLIPRERRFDDVADRRHHRAVATCDAIARESRRAHVCRDFTPSSRCERRARFTLNEIRAQKRRAMSRLAQVNPREP